MRMRRLFSILLELILLELILLELILLELILLIKSIKINYNYFKTFLATFA